MDLQFKKLVLRLLLAIMNKLPTYSNPGNPEYEEQIKIKKEVNVYIKK